MNLRAVLASGVERLGLIADHGVWVEEERILLCADPTSDKALAKLARERRISVLVNLRERAHDPTRLARFGLTEIHFAVPDKAAPSPGQITFAIAAIERILGAGQRVAVHCRNGRGRSGTVLACYLMRHRGFSADEAIARVRAVRPGAVETQEQAAAVRAYADAPVQQGLNHADTLARESAHALDEAGDELGHGEP
jgi:atypical dual specificity phosphatase